MRVGIYAPARSSFVLTGPLWHAARHAGHEVVLLRDPWRALKPGDRWVDAEADETMVGFVNTFDGDWLVAAIGECARLTGRRARLCAADVWLDSIARPAANAADFTHRTIQHGLIPTDGLADITPGEPRDILWFPPKTLIPGRAQRAVRYVIVSILAWALHQAAHRHGLRLVVKTRSKMRIPRLVRRLADSGLDDGGPLYPSPSLEALGTAALAVCHQSGAAFEATAAGVRCLSVRLPQRHLRHHGNYPLLRARCHSPYAWPGVIDAMDLQEAVRWLTRWRPGLTPDPNTRATLIDTWFGGRVIGTSDWLIRELEART